MAVSRLSQTSLQNAFQKYNNTWDGLSAVGSMDSLGVYTAPTAGSANITFSSIPQTYSRLHVRAVVKSEATGTQNTMFARFNGDSSSKYSIHGLLAYGSTPTYTADAGNARTELEFYDHAALSGNAGVVSAFTMDLFDYTSSTKYKTTLITSAFDNNGTAQATASIFDGLYQSQTAISSVTFLFQSGYDLAAGSTIALYGIK
jgi:hypothetical protein